MVLVWLEYRRRNRRELRRLKSQDIANQVLEQQAKTSNLKHSNSQNHAFKQNQKSNWCCERSNKHRPSKSGGQHIPCRPRCGHCEGTRHDKYPSEEKYIREILSLTCYSRAFISACVNTLSRRLNKTRSWAVALKTLVLIQRLLSEGDPAYEQEIFFSTRRGTRLFNLSDFRDNSKSNPWDFSSYVRTYALYLDEWLEYRMQSRRGKRSMFGLEDDDEEYRETESEREREKDREAVGRSTPLRDMAIEPLFSKMQHLQLLLERFLACRPTGLQSSELATLTSYKKTCTVDMNNIRNIQESTKHSYMPNTI